MLARAMAVMLQSMGLDTVIYSLRSLRRGGGTTAISMAIIWIL